MAALTLYELGDARVWVRTLVPTDTPETLCAQVPYTLNFEGISSYERQRERAAARALLAYALGSEARIAYRPDGGPTLQQAQGYISVSHSHGVVALAWHPTCPLGIDVECFGTKMARVRTRFLQADELAWQQANDERYTQAHLCWTAKEAIFKILGQPVTDFLQSQTVQAFTPEPQGIMQVQAQGLLYPVHYWLTDVYALAVVLNK